MTIKLPLKKPIQAHGQTVSELTFDEPDGDAIIECGVPVDTVQRNGETVSVINTKTCGALIARLANIPPSSVKAMGAKDILAACGIVAGFFGDEEATPTKP